MSKKAAPAPASAEIAPVIDVDSTNMSGELEKTVPNVRYSPAPYDPLLIHRVKEYLSLHSEQRQVDIVEMADYLQAKYREYTRRKRKAFQAYVKNAYEMLLDEYKRQNVATCWSDEDDSEDDDDVIENDDDDDEPPNHLNDGLMKLYQNKLAEHSEPINITISSDEDEEPAAPEKNKVDNKKNDMDTAKKLRANLSAVPNAIAESRKRKYPPSVNSSALNASSGSVPSKRKRDVAVIESKITFENIGGLNNVLEEVCKLLVHIKHPEIHRQIGVTPPRGFLLHGPPGCGKTLLANAIAGELSIPLVKVSAPELIAGVSGESEERIRNLFEQAAEAAPCILFIDEVDAITPNRQNAQREMERRVVAQLLTCLDELSNHENGDQVLVIGATNRPDSIDPALRRAGRFDREVTMGIPDINARIDILHVLCKSLKLEADFDYKALAALTPGFVGADLTSLVREAAMAAVDRIIRNLDNKPKVTEEKQEEKTENSPKSTVENGEVKPDTTENASSEAVTSASSNEIIEETPKTPQEQLLALLRDTKPISEEHLSNVQIIGNDFQLALRSVQPSAKREGFATVPDVTWDDVGSLKDIREELKLAILAPVRHAEQFEQMGLTTPTGVLLCGPPGCGKTLLAKAVANEAGINFLSVKGPELLNMYVGESERAVRLCFQRARNSAPCVIFFDELDALTPRRSDTGENGASMRVVNQMLTEMDGVQGRRGVYLMAATNRPEIVDPAVLRPGRFDKILYVGLPTPADRVDILRAVTKNGTRPKLATDVDLSVIGRADQCSGYTGADLAALVREAAVLALREHFDQEKNSIESLCVTTGHFEQAIAKIRPSVSDKDKVHYEKLRRIYSVASQLSDDNEIEDVQMADV